MVATINPFDESVVVATVDDSIQVHGQPLAVKPVAVWRAGSGDLVGYVPMLFGVQVYGRAYSVLCPMLAELLGLLYTPAELAQPTPQACMEAWQAYAPVERDVDLSPQRVPPKINERVIANQWLRCTDQDFYRVTAHFHKLWQESL